MNIPNDIITLKDQGVSDHDIIELIELKGAKETEIVEKLTEFYLKKNATQYIQKEKIESSFPLIQLIITIILLSIASYLGWIIVNP
jgi:hypothetical protein